MSSILLIHPPVAKLGEPPAGITALAGCLQPHGIDCTLLDANLEALLFLIGRQADARQDTRSDRALRHRDANLAAVRTPELYRHPGRYHKAVHELNYALQLAAHSHLGVSISLTNYQDEHHNPLAGNDLLNTAETFQNSLFFPWFCSRLPPLLDAVKPLYIGISLCYLSQALPTFALLGFLKDRYPEARLILGGGLITSWMSNPRWHNPFAGLVDHCIAGPGEEPLLRLFSAQKTKTHQPPVYTGLPLSDYLAPGPILPYAASRGCYWNRCSFCPETAEQSRYQQTPPAIVLDHLHSLCRQLQPVLIHFLDNAISPLLLQTLAEQPPGVSWYGFTRIHEQLADPDFCRQLRASGCVLLKLGLESGSQEVLDTMHKGIHLELISRVLAALQAAGIATYVYLLFGTPAESLDEARQTMEFTLRHHAAITFLNLAIFNMPITSDEAHRLPGTIFSESNLSLYKDFVHPRNWDRRAVRIFLDREFRRQPQIAAILRRDPPFFSSNHAAFFTENYP
ncbi:MAG: radical SAM protein [Desulfobulbus oligotrophicus]|jgi:radical SAM superfamily enzyme YgiQ (UPF0313 family)|nr:radical SAM protein [Desulfobulbus oligotrophicus]